jgi:peptide deformylase
MPDGATIHLRQHGLAGAPRLVLSHGNGLAIDGYFPFWGPLRERYEVILFDFRNHGHNPLHTLEGHTWQNFVADMDVVWHAINRELGAKPAAGLFHSLSGVTAAMHALKYGRRFDALVLFDPPVYPRAGHPIQYQQQSDKESLASRAARRPASYKDPMELARQFARRFKRWVPDAYELMARATLRHDRGSGDWILACPREYEAHVFSSGANPDLWLQMAHCPVPVKLVCGDPKSSACPTKRSRTRRTFSKSSVPPNVSAPSNRSSRRSDSPRRLPFDRFVNSVTRKMALLKIRKFPDDTLKEPAAPVKNINGTVEGLIDSMVQTMYAAPGVGLAAPQVGESKRIIVLDTDHEQPGKHLLKLINPQVVEAEGKIVWEEGCLSVIDYTADVERAAHVLVRAWTPDEKEIEIEADELLAVALQHEIDHLDGKLFIDRISRIKRELYKRKLKKLIKEGKADDARPSTVRI